MKTETFIQLELAPNDSALKSSENPEALKKLMGEVKVLYRSLGIGMHFEDDKTQRERIQVKVTRGTRTIQFDYGMSINDTEALYNAQTPDGAIDLKGHRRAKEKVKTGLLSQILSCIGNEYYCPKSFTDFCSEFGYDEDSKKADKTHRALLEQSAKLEKIFSEDEIQALPR